MTTKVQANPLRSTILLIAANWTVSAYNMDLVRELHAKGHMVDVLVTPRSRFRFTSHPAETGQLILACNTLPQIYLRFWTLWRLLSIALGFLLPVDPWLRRSARAHLAGRRYDAVIALEKESLLLALHGGIEALQNTKITYWSHELYTVGYPNYYRYRSLDTWALHALQDISGILIQDERRHKVLVRHAPQPGPPPFFLPITERGPAYTGPAMDLRSELGLSPDSILLISHGLVGSLRGVGFLCELGRELGEGHVVVIHGERIDDSLPDFPPNVRLFEKRFDHEGLLAFLSGFDIGLTIYAQNNIENDRLTAFSSHKMAIYSRCGLPFIALRNESYEDLLERMDWGKTVVSVKEAAEAVRHLLASKDAYRKRARSCYETVYRLETYSDELEAYLLGPANVRTHSP